jgi:hypothetical protein
MLLCCCRPSFSFPSLFQAKTRAKKLESILTGHDLAVREVSREEVVVGGHVLFRFFLFSGFSGFSGLSGSTVSLPSRSLSLSLSPFSWWRKRRSYLVPDSVLLRHELDDAVDEQEGEAGGRGRIGKRKRAKRGSTGCAREEQEDVGRKWKN